MILFVVCSHCRETVEDRRTLDIAGLVDWTCPRCGKINEIISGDSDDIEIVEDCEEAGEITVESNDIDPENMKNNILEGTL